MKKLISALSLLCVIFCLQPASAQVRVGPTLGMNLNDMLIKDKIVKYSVENKMKVGFHIGGIAEYSFMDDVSLEAGLLFTNKGYKQDTGKTNVQMSLNYLEIPVRLVYKLEIHKVKTVLFAGPYISYALSGTWKSNNPIFLTETGDPTSNVTIKFGGDIKKDQLKRMDFGLNFGGGVEINKYTVSLNYDLGLSNISVVNADGLTMRNQVILLSVGYKFDLNLEL